MSTAGNVKGFIRFGRWFAARKAGMYNNIYQVMIKKHHTVVLENDGAVQLLYALEKGWNKGLSLLETMCMTGTDDCICNDSTGEDTEYM